MAPARLTQTEEVESVPSISLTSRTSHSTSIRTDPSRQSRRTHTSALDANPQKGRLLPQYARRPQSHCHETSLRRSACVGFELRPRRHILTGTSGPRLSGNVYDLCGVAVDADIALSMFVIDRRRQEDSGDDGPSETVDIAGSTGNVYEVTIGRMPRCTVRGFAYASSDLHAFTDCAYEYCSAPIASRETSASTLYTQVHLCQRFGRSLMGSRSCAMFSKRPRTYATNSPI